jgi:hypothetical protein
VYRHQLVGWSELFDRWPMPRYVVRLEDLHDAPRETMRRLAAWLGIAWDERLLASSWNGLAYWGDKMAAARQNGFSGAHTRTSPEKDEVLGALDRYVLTGLGASFLEAHGYGRAPWHARALAPLLAHLPTRLERRAMREAPLPAARAIVARWAYTYRHLARKLLPRRARAHLPLPRPMGPGLRPPTGR